MYIYLYVYIYKYVYAHYFKDVRTGAISIYEEMYNGNETDHCCDVYSFAYLCKVSIRLGIDI